MALFTSDTHFVVYMDSKSKTPSQELHGRDALAAVFDNLNIYEATTHFNGQSTIKLDGTLATGVSYCLAHHVKNENGKRSLMVASIRYLDTLPSKTGLGISLSANSWRTGSGRIRCRRLLSSRVSVRSSPLDRMRVSYREVSTYF